MSSAAKIAANQRNAQLSTGPTSETGKSKSSLNAVKTGLTGHTVLLPSDDAAAYEAHVAQFLKRYQPSGDAESRLAHSSPTPSGVSCAFSPSKWASTP